MNRKGVEMSLQTIVIAALVLLILIVLIIIFSNQMSTTQTSLNSCLERGGTCEREGSPCSDGSSFYRASGCGDDEICCLPDSVVLPQDS